MEGRNYIINKLIIEISEKLSPFLSDFNFENDLRKYKIYFTGEEIDEYIEKVKEMEYLSINKIGKKMDIEVYIYLFLEMENFLIKLREKKNEYIRMIIKKCLNSLNDQVIFSKFVNDSEFFFDNYFYYFDDEIVKKYKELWFNLEIENALLLATEKNSEVWGKNYELITKRIREMLIFLISLDK